MPSKVIAVALQKGGTAKTTTCVSLGVGLAQEGKRVLLVDADSQGSMTISLGHPQPDNIEPNLATVMAKIMTDTNLENR